MALPLPDRLTKRGLGAIAAVVVALILAGCQVDPRVDIDVSPDGSGMVRVAVTLDAAAMAEIGDPSLVRLDDVRAGGWDVPAPETSTAGSVTFRASKRFASRDQLQPVLDEIGGSDPGGGLFRAFHLDVDDSWWSTAYSLSGSLHSTGSAEQFSDAEVAKTLDGLALGRTAEQITADLGGRPVSMVVSVHLPGEPTGTTESSIVVVGGAASEQAVMVSSTEQKSGPIWWFLGAIVAALIAAACVVLSRRHGGVTVSVSTVDPPVDPPDIDPA